MVRTYGVSNVKYKGNGQIDEQSLRSVFATLSSRSGQGKRLEGKIQKIKFSESNSYAQSRYAMNSDPNRTPYSIWFNNCSTFAAETLNKGGGAASTLPWPILAFGVTYGKGVKYP